MSRTRAAKPLEFLRVRQFCLASLLPAVLLLAGCSGTSTQSTDGNKNEIAENKAGAAEKEVGTAPAEKLLTGVQKRNPSVEPDKLIAEVEKHHGYVRTDKKDPARPVLTIRFRDPGPKDGDLEQLRPFLQESAVPLFLGVVDRDLADCQTPGLSAD